MQPQVQLDVTFVSRTGRLTKPVTFDRAIIGGWTGRDKQALQHHIDELAALGVKPPAKTPMFYAVSVLNLTMAKAIDVVGDASSGEVEYTLIQHDGALWVGAGSDHTDRHFEQFGITLAKQMCAKPLAAEFWPLHEIRDHWDQIRMRSFIRENDTETLYQEGAFGGLLSPDELLERLAADGGAMREGTLLFGGTTSAIGGVRFSTDFRYEITDPVLDRTIGSHYEICPLPISG